MEVKIGIQTIPREFVLETNSSREEVEESLAAALSDGGLFTLSDDKGGRLLVPADKIAYIEFGGGDSRRIGFGQYT